MNVLVVDDEPVQLTTLKRGLSSLGHKVLLASTGLDALACLEQGLTVDLVITDYSMPGMDGLDLLSRIRQIHGQLPVILMTAYAEKDLVIQALRQGCNNFIEKPFTLETLVQEIERVVGEVSSHLSGAVPAGIPKLMHQYNNSLQSIAAGAELGMMRAEDSKAVKGLLTNILMATNRMSEINRRILRLRRNGCGARETLDLRDLLNESVSQLSDIFELKQVEFFSFFPEEPIFVTVNAFDLKQALCNLLMNAVESMQESKLRRLSLSVELNRLDQLANISLIDTGQGIHQEALQKIFDTYFTTKKEGTGLGLAVVKEIVDLHHGSVEVLSNPGQGTAFTVRIPLAQPAGRPGDAHVPQWRQCE